MGWIASAWSAMTSAAPAAAPATGAGLSAGAGGLGGAAIGSVGAGAVAPVVAPAVSGLATAGNILSIASTGLGLYQSVTADGGSAPRVPNAALKAAAADKKANTAIKERRRSLAKIGRKSTFKTEQSSGLSTKPRTSKKTLLGAGG